MEDEIHFVYVCPRFLTLHQEPFATKRSYSECSQKYFPVQLPGFPCHCQSSKFNATSRRQEIKTLASCSQVDMTDFLSRRRESTYVDVRDFLFRRREVFSGQRERVLTST